MRAIVSTFALTVTNPATLLSFTAMFAGLGGLAGGAGSYGDAGFVVAGVVGGSTGWWLALTTVIGLFHTRIDEKAMRIINRACGVLVMGCGLAVLIHLAIKSRGFPEFLAAQGTLPRFQAWDRRPRLARMANRLEP